MARRIIIFAALVVSTVWPAFGAVKHIGDFGLRPGDGSNAVPYVAAAIEYCRRNPGTHLMFAPGRYDFYPDGGVGVDNSRMNAPGEVAISIDSVADMTFDGCGAEFVFHGKMSVVMLAHSRNIELRDFSVDWDRPMLSQGEIVACENDYLDLKVDKRSYPYVIERDTVFFTGEGWKMPVLAMYSTLYDKESKEIAYTTWDATFGNLFTEKAEEIAPGIIRFHGAPGRIIAPGNVVALYHVRYFANGITIAGATDVTLKDITLYHTLGHGVCGIHSENITMDNVSSRVNDAKGRYFSIVADASHFTECKGQINVFGCAHTGQGDDFINVHGTSVRILDVIDSVSVKVPVFNKGNGRNVEPGDEFWFIKASDAQRGSVRRVISKEYVDAGDDSYFLVAFDAQLPDGIAAGDFLENKTWIPDLHIRGCKILKRHRARGILATTPGKVVIEDNYFRTAGSAILLEGDFDFWYESGANMDITIRNNVFDNCLTSGAKENTRGQWGYAVINISPSFVPKDTHTEPYHRNIVVTGNQFRMFDAPIVNAASVGNFRFCNNEIIRTDDYEPYTWQKSAMRFEGCRDVVIESNSIDPAFETRDIELRYMQPWHVSSQEEFVCRYE